MLLSSCWSDRNCYLLMWKIAVSNRFTDLQKYPRNRKSKRKQQPKYVLPFQWLQVAPLCACQINRSYLFNFWRVFCLFFVPKGFNWEAASGPRPEALALVLPDSELPAFWKLAPWLDDIKLNPADGGRYQGRFKLHASVSTATLKPANFQVAACFWVAPRRPSGGTSHMPKH